MNEDIIKAREAVQSLFSNPTTLQVNATDYQVDQAAKLVECISDPIYTKEKMCLLEQVKLAKRLSRTRNLLNYGDFESPKWWEENGWKTSTYVSVRSDNPIFTGRYLHLPSAYQPQLSNRIFPTYAYQKIEESKLKPYTRYSLRAFIGNSTDLEVFAIRYDKDVHKKMCVPNDIIPTNPCTGEYLLKQNCHPVVTNQVIPQNTFYDSYGNGSHRIIQQTSTVCTDPHEWQCHIDTGELDMIQNLGIWVGFKIGTTDGIATIDNVEVVEVGPLTGDALTRMKKREQRWQKKWAEKQMRIERDVQAANQAIQALFTDSNQNQLQSTITLKQILEAETWVEQIPYVYNPFLVGAIPVVPGETYDIVQQLAITIGIARGLYTQRNLVRNGDFTAGLANWNATEGAEVQQIGNISILKLSDWSATVSQHVCVKPEHSYLLRVTARKEDTGEGYVTISDGTIDNTETLNFTVEEGTTSIMNYASNPYETNAYPNNITNNKEIGCGCYDNYRCCHNHDEYPIMEQNTLDLSNYITKTVEIFPETNHVCIEIGETAGTFEVASIELIAIECE
ncbi:hypothetical protein CN980_29530 [Bacillus cereus]|uniref:Pesticidal crystal protein Cry domain-containing protein n=1 Tax=Bacillus cereus TaxID=1396 RepID=A0A9X7GM70_BACCE|nr:hypothetical protein [Bacillus cereus]PGO61561.1 hypothetical protein CN980_29530 [Bacillus cereus]